jgi:hypothetical protein
LSSPEFLSRPLHSEKKSLEARIIYLSVLFHFVREYQGADEGVGRDGRTLLDPCSRDITMKGRKLKIKRSARPD